MSLSSNRRLTRCSNRRSVQAVQADHWLAEHGTREGFYAYVYNEPRPESFFKGTARVCVGPNQPIGIRPDSKFTAPEPELALAVNSKGEIQGYMVGNDVSARNFQLAPSR